MEHMMDLPLLFSVEYDIHNELTIIGFKVANFRCSGIEVNGFFTNIEIQKAILAIDNEDSIGRAQQTLPQKLYELRGR